MKKILYVALCLLLVFTLSGCSSSTSNVDPNEEYGCNVLNVYNWGEYIGEDVISNFEDAYNVKVNYSLFDSNEAMYTKILGGSHYDILVPSDYMIERLIEEDLLQPLDYDIITNTDLLYEGTLNKDYDPDNTYSIPYFWGNVGIVYDKTIVDPSDVESQGWEVFKNTKYKGQIYMYDSERDAFMVALKALGYSMNTENEDEINEAYEWLVDVQKTMEPAYVTDEAIDGLIFGEKAMGFMYSGDAAYILSQNENMAFFVPEEGTNIWTDAMVIPKNADCPKLANEFINYILTYDASYDNSSTVGYASSNAEVLESMSAEDGEYYGNDAYIARTDNPKDEVFRNNEVLREKLSELWIKVKNSWSNDWIVKTVQFLIFIVILTIYIN